MEGAERKPVRAVVFDLDGVLLDSLGAHLNYCARIAKDLGLNLRMPTPEAFRDDIVRRGVKISPMVHFFRAVGFSEEQAGKGDTRYREEFQQERLELFPGVAEMLSTLSDAGLLLGLVTSNVRNVVESSLGEHLDLFQSDCVFADDDRVTRTKKEAIEECLRTIGLFPEELLFVGDQLADRKAAKEADVRFMGVTYGWGISKADKGSGDTADSRAQVTRHVAAKSIPEKSAKLALEHARDKFAYHANQRHASIRFYFVALAIVVTGFIGLLTSRSGTLVTNSPLIGIALGATGAFVSACFWILDHRNDMLVRCDERLLKVAEKRLALLHGIEAFEIVATSDAVRPSWVRYERVMPLMFGFFILLSTLGSVYSVSLLSPPDSRDEQLLGALVVLFLATIPILVTTSLQVSSRLGAQLRGWRKSGER